MNVHVSDRLFPHLNLQRVQLRHELYFGGSGLASCTLALLTCASPRGKETGGKCLVLWCGGSSGGAWRQRALELSVGSCRAASRAALLPGGSRVWCCGVCVGARVEPWRNRSRWCCSPGPGSAPFTSAE